MLILGEHFTFLILVAKSWTKSRLRLWSVCSSRAYEGKDKTNSSEKSKNFVQALGFLAPTQYIDGAIEFVLKLNTALNEHAN